MSSQKIFLVEDDSDLNQMLTDFLSSEGFSVQSFTQGKELLDNLVEGQPDLLLLDYMLPDMTGVEICQACRPEFQGPVVMLTAHDNDMVEISSINEGANSFLTKPVRPHVLLAHIKALLKAPVVAKVEDNIISSGALKVDMKSFTATMDGETLILSDSEFELLAFLAKNSGTIFSRDEIFTKMRGIEYDGLDRSIDMRISVLRQKLNDQTPPYKYIKTIRSKGYVFIAG